MANRFQPGLKFTQISFCRVKTANPGSSGLVEKSVM